MSTASDARVSVVDRLLNDQQPSFELAAEFFDIADALTASPNLRRVLADQGTPAGARTALIDALFGQRVSASALSVLQEATRLRWTTAGAFVNALERQGVRTALLVAQAEGQLDDVEDQLFRVGRLVNAHGDLRTALGDKRVPLEARQRLLVGLLQGRAHRTTVSLAKRAVLARRHSFDETLEEYLGLVAELRNRGVATVEVARPLTPEQTRRLRAALRDQMGREVTLHVVLDPAVVGGVRVSVGDEVIDGTVAARFDDARRQLS